jgi:flagellar hook-associated protein 3 FlgL
LKSCNEDKEISDIIIEYTAAFNAYQASLLAAGKIEKQTLLDYI